MSTDARLPSDAIPHLIAAYGSRFRDVLEDGSDQPSGQARLSDSSPVVGAEIAWAARREMALTLADAVIRRTPLGALGYPGDAAAQRAASIMGSVLGWTAERRTQELDNLRRFYQ